MTAARDSSVTGVSRVGEKRTERKEQKLFLWMGFRRRRRRRRWERWQAEGRFLLLLKEEIIPRYKITALPRCSFGRSLPLSPSSISIHPRTNTTTNTNLKAETTLTTSLPRDHRIVFDWRIKHAWRTLAGQEKLLSFFFEFYEVHLLSVTWLSSSTFHSRGARFSFTRKNYLVAFSNDVCSNKYFVLFCCIHAPRNCLNKWVGTEELSFSIASFLKSKYF